MSPSAPKPATICQCEISYRLQNLPRSPQSARPRSRSKTTRSRSRRTPIFPAVRLHKASAAHAAGREAGVSKEGHFLVDGEPRYMEGTIFYEGDSMSFGVPTYGYPPSLKWLYETTQNYEDLQRLGFDTVGTGLPNDWMRKYRKRFIHLRANDEMFCATPKAACRFTWTLPRRNGARGVEIRRGNAAGEGGVYRPREVVPLDALFGECPRGTPAVARNVGGRSRVPEKARHKAVHVRALQRARLRRPERIQQKAFRQKDEVEIRRQDIAPERRMGGVVFRFDEISGFKITTKTRGFSWNG